MPKTALSNPGHLTDKQRMFCQLYVSGPTGIRYNTVQAGLEAGYTPNNITHNAHYIKDSLVVKAEIARLEAEKWGSVEISQEEEAQWLSRIRELALLDNKLADANKSTELRCKLGGLLRERVDVYGYAGRRPDSVVKAAVAASKALISSIKGKDAQSE